MNVNVKQVSCLKMETSEIPVYDHFSVLNQVRRVKWRGSVPKRQKYEVGLGFVSK